MKKLKQRVIDGFSQSQQSSTGSSVNRPDVDVPEVLGSSNFQLKKTVRHGFPHMPSALALDPVQNTLAIGTKSGSIRFFGKPGVDFHVNHDNDVPVTQLQFVVNEGGLISVLEDNSIHYWSLQQKYPTIVHSLKFNRERITFSNLPLRSKFLYVGTERGNVHIVNIESFTVSGYQIQWNKAIGATRSGHPGPVVCISECPDDDGKLLTAFENGLVVLWDLKSRDTDLRYQCDNNIKSIAWHPDARHFTCALHDGSLVCWNIKTTSKPASVLYPHALPPASGSGGGREPCRPICKVEVRTTKSGIFEEQLTLFSGGLPYDAAKHRPSLTVMRGKSVTVLEMEHYILDFISLADSPYLTEPTAEPTAVVALLQNDLVVMDLSSEGYPCFENPYPMDVHESPVYCVRYIADCPDDLIPQLYQVALKSKQRAAYSRLPWPISGGNWKAHNASYPEIVLTGHMDGSIKFWDATAVSLQLLYKMKTSRLFEKNRDLAEEDPHAITLMDFDAKHRVLVTAANAGHVIVMSFSKEENTGEIPSLSVSLGSDATSNPGGGVYNGEASPATKDSRNPSSNCSEHNSLNASPTNGARNGASGAAAATGGRGVKYALKVKPGVVKLLAGFQAELVCQVGSSCDDVTPPITAIHVNAVYGMVAFATSYGVCLLDMTTKTIVLSCLTPDLYPSPSSNPQGSSEGSGGPPTVATPRSRKSPRIKHGPRSQDSFAESIPGSDDLGGGKGVDERGVSNQDRTDGGGSSSFSRSRSSSMSSLERADCSDAVTVFHFNNTFPLKSDFTALPTLWIGTSMSSIICIQLAFTPSAATPTTSAAAAAADVPTAAAAAGTPARVTATVLGCVFTVKGAVVSFCFLDSNGSLIRSPEDMDNERKLGAMQKQGVNQLSPNDEPDRQFLVIASDKEARVISLPSQTTVFKMKLTETSYIVRADPIIVSGGVCLACYVANGHVVVYSVPSLRPLLDAEYLPLTDLRSWVTGGGSGACDGGTGGTQGGGTGEYEYHLCDMTPDLCTVKIARTFCFSHGGQAVYLCSPSELQRITVSSEICDKLGDMIGELHVGSVEMPEAPTKGLIKSFFSSASSVDRNELFGESAGKASKGLAKYQPGATNLSGSQAAAGSAAGEAFKAKMALVERGEKLSQVEEATAQMMMSAQNLSSTTGQLADKFKNKKWYQL